MKLFSGLSAVVLSLGLVTGVGAAQEPHTVPAAACMPGNGNHFNCNREGFQRVFVTARTVRIDTSRIDVYGADKMRALMTGLGKTIVLPEQQPDLIVELSYVDRGGRIDVGPASISLASLKVYQPATGGGRHMVWSETWDGQDERPWPAIVGDLSRQFHDVVAPKH
jgi:hypothetical protein